MAARRPQRPEAARQGAAESDHARLGGVGFGGSGEEAGIPAVAARRQMHNEAARQQRKETELLAESARRQIGGSEARPDEEARAPGAASAPEMIAGSATQREEVEPTGRVGDRIDASATPKRNPMPSALLLLRFLLSPRSWIGILAAREETEAIMQQQEPWHVVGAVGLRPTKSAPCSPIKPAAVMLRTHSDSFHVAHKVPVGDTPYVRAKRVQLVDKDPVKAIALFWAAINAGDRVDSALKDMAIVMKQQNRAEEAIEAIKSLRSCCSDQAQESLDNILLDLYKRCGRLDDQISLLKHKMQLIHQGVAFNGKRTKTARSQGRKFQVTLEQEATRLLGNLGWALMQKENYTEAEGAYRRALLIGSDNNKMCNLGICLMKQGRVLEAKDVLKQVRPAAVDGLRGADSHLKAYERAQEMLRDLEAKLVGRPRAGDQLDKRWLFDALLLGSSSSIWQPQPCIDHLLPPLPRDHFADENACVNKKVAAPALQQPNILNVEAQPFYLLRMPPLAMKPQNAPHLQQQQPQKPAQVHDPMSNLKRTRSGNAMDKAGEGEKERGNDDEKSGRRKSLSAEERWPELPDHRAFDEALVAAVLAPVLDDEALATEGNGNDNGKPAPASCDTSPAVKEKMGKRLRIFEDITQTLNTF